nr:hypothetical protein [Tanacetum cinerariifolium]
MHKLPAEPSSQEAFEDLVMNFILDEEDGVKQLKEYIKVIWNDFMQLSLEVIRKLNEEIRSEKSRIKKSRRSQGTSLIASTPMLSPDPNWENLFQMNKPVYRETEEKQKQCLFWNLDGGVGLYSEEQSMLARTRSGLRRGETVKAENVLMQFCPTIKDDEVEEPADEEASGSTERVSGDGITNFPDGVAPPDL